MYHYVRPDIDRLPDYYHLSLEDFRKQLDYLEETYGFVEYADFRRAFERPDAAPPDGVVLTFDDGFRDHYDVVYPELAERGLWGVFYVPTKPIVDHEILDVHKVHILLGELETARLLSMLRERVSEEMVPHRKRADFRTTYEHHDDTDNVKIIKRTLNFYLMEKYRSSVLDQILEAASLDPRWDDFYATAEEFREMHRNGMVIGAHTVSHPVLSKLDRGEQLAEISGSLEHLTRRLGDLKAKTFCYPYGLPSSYDDRTIEIVRELGFDWAFAVQSKDISVSDLRDRYTLPRYDCNELPHGEASGTIG